MTTPALALVAEPERLRLALSPLRRDLLERLHEPASATELADALGLSRQRVNYHLRALEEVGLVELVEQRQRRGFVERVLRATADAFIVDPSVMTAGEAEAFTDIQDRHASEHLVGVAAGTVRDVARMQANAERKGKRLLTFTIEAEIRFAEPGDVHEFTDALAEAVTSTALRFDTQGGRRYRLIVGGHPAPQTKENADE